MVIIITLATLLILLFLMYLLIRPVITGAVYFPTSKRNLEKIIEFAEVKPGQKAADLGSGDGRILVALAKSGATAYGYEVNPLLVWRSRKAVKDAGLEGKAFVTWRSFWGEDFSSFDIVVVYGIPSIMKRLGKKLSKELKPGARVISNIFHIPDWTPERYDKESNVYCYLKR